MRKIIVIKDGIVCTKCYGRTGIIDTRKFRNGVRRKRKCLDSTCGVKFTTIEMIEDLGFVND